MSTSERTTAIATGVALVLGWLLITAGLPFRPRIVWPVSLGLLLITAAGWRLLFTIGSHGLYALTKDSDDA
jgi:hypothetical protein